MEYRLTKYPDLKTSYMYGPNSEIKIYHRRVTISKQRTNATHAIVSKKPRPNVASTSAACGHTQSSQTKQSPTHHVRQKEKKLASYALSPSFCLKEHIVPRFQAIFCS
jgi:hypothetical protein